MSTQDKILELLKRKKGFVSGEELGELLGVSRQALWKHIQELRQIGYEVSSIPHLGYQLVTCPDRMYPQELAHGLRTACLGKKIHYSESIGSTMDLALERALAGEAQGTLVVSEAQLRGRGRLSRTWVSPKYKGIYFSLILRPQIGIEKTPLLTLMTAVGVCDALKETAQVDAQIKWPNDIILGNKKAGGILTEIKAETDAISFVVVGLGLNVNNDAKTLVNGATSVKEYKKSTGFLEPNIDINRVALTQSILRHIEQYYSILSEDGIEQVLERWRNYNVTLGKRVRVDFHKATIEGQAVDIDVDGGLLVRCDSGFVQKITAGDIVHCR